jgi:hypothetical protein
VTGLAQPQAFLDGQFFPLSFRGEQRVDQPERGAMGVCKAGDADTLEVVRAKLEAQMFFAFLRETNELRPDTVRDTEIPPPSLAAGPVEPWQRPRKFSVSQCRARP